MAEVQPYSSGDGNLKAQEDCPVQALFMSMLYLSVACARV